FIFDPSGRLAYWWSSVVSAAFTYNFWVIIYRIAIQEINDDTKTFWFSLDYTADAIYFLDIFFRFRTGYLDDGVLETNSFKLRIRYMNSTLFYSDCLSLLPLDFLYLSFGFKSACRCFRLVKIYRFWSFLDRTERHTNWPNVIRSLTLLHYVMAIFHWNTCLSVIVWRTWGENNSSSYIHANNANNNLNGFFYRSSLHMTSAGSLDRSPVSKAGFLFAVLQFVFGLLLFAAILGHVANIVANVSANKRDFQTRLDQVKHYMTTRRVPEQLQLRVIRWFDYLWTGKKRGESAVDEDVTLSLLPDKLRSEIALHLHLETLKRVEVFQHTEVGFLRSLVLCMKSVLFSPGDFICRKGEIGREMYVVSRGKLQVLSDEGSVLATLKPGSYFGELSILNTGSNRRTASVISVGHSDLFCLSKVDLWNVLQDYPRARIRLEAIALKKMQGYQKAEQQKEKQGLFSFCIFLIFVFTFRLNMWKNMWKSFFTNIIGINYD
ncbi:hypothetical protein HELRODRAFT_82034, partial [Helobdella robusta]|uniref:Cyclic nucleotide-binding domain-containing protein n=1 Tax=Helobdella robusta TaxID=6412 RepID=T1G4M2_HELRO